jgi:hypothetical protein
MASWISDRRFRTAARTAVLVLLVAAALRVSPARADAPVPPDGATRRAARAKLVQGVRLLRREDYQGALAKFEEAYALVPSPKIHYDLGLAQLGLSHDPDALEAFESFLSDAPGAPADKRHKAEEYRAALRDRIGSVEIASDVDGAEVSIDGRSRGTTPLTRPILLAPGTHEIAARASNGAGAPHIERIEIAPRQNLRVTLRLRTDVQLVAARSPPVVGATLSAPPEKAGGDERGGEGAALSIGDARRRSRILGIASVSVGVVLLASGVTFGLLAKSESDSLSGDAAAHRDFVPSKETHGTTYQTLQIIGLCAGAVAVAGGAIVYGVARRDQRPDAASAAARASMTWTPMLAPAAAGGSIAFNF